MGKQRQRLKYVCDAALLGRNVDAQGRVKQDTFADRNFPGVRAKQPREAIEQRGFSRAGGPEQDGDSRRRVEGDIENKRCAFAPLLLNARDQRSGIYFALHRVHAGVHTRRLTAYTRQSTPKAMARRSNASWLASPYSSVCAKLSTPAVTTPGKDKGRITRRKVSHFPDPKTAEASSSLGSTASNEAMSGCTP